MKKRDVSAGADEIDAECAAELCWGAVKGFTLGPFQQHMTRYQLELAQCNGNMGMALLRTFVDSCVSFARSLDSFFLLLLLHSARAHADTLVLLSLTQPLCLCVSVSLFVWPFVCAFVRPCSYLFDLYADGSDALTEGMLRPVGASTLQIPKEPVRRSRRA